MTDVEFHGELYKSSHRNNTDVNKYRGDHPMRLQYRHSLYH